MAQVRSFACNESRSAREFDSYSYERLRYIQS
jgi:hypothetical protein